MNVEHFRTSPQIPSEDPRHPDCATLKYSIRLDEKISVIIVFYNEPEELVIHTIESIVRLGYFQISKVNDLNLGSNVLILFIVGARKAGFSRRIYPGGRRQSSSVPNSDELDKREPNSNQYDTE